MEFNMNTIVAPGLRALGVALAFSWAGMAHAQKWDGEAKPVLSGSAALLEKSTGVLTKPSGLGSGITVATAEPSIQFMTIDAKDLPRHGGSPQSGYSDLALGPDGKFYFSVGNHMGYGADVVVYRYDPATRRYERLFHLEDIAPWTKNDPADGKIHCRLVISPEGILVASTYGGGHTHRWRWNEVGYKGAYIFRYNIHTGQHYSFGQPALDSWRHGVWDPKREIFFGIGEWARQSLYGQEKQWGKVLAFDTKNEKVIVGHSLPPDNQQWHNGAEFYEPDSGWFHSVEHDAPYRFLRYEVKTNTFRRLKSSFGKWMSTSSSERGEDGAYFIVDHDGDMHKYFPEQDSLVKLADFTRFDERNIASLRLSPGKRYLYYVTRAGTGGAVVQYNTRSGQSKVLAFLTDHFFGKHNYYFHNTYGIELSRDGSGLFISANGVKGKKGNFGDPALFYLEIPLSERSDDPKPDPSTRIRNHQPELRNAASPRLLLPGMPASAAPGDAYTVQGRSVQRTVRMDADVPSSP